jgi:hypothetical protein
MRSRLAWLLLILAVATPLVSACGESDEEKAKARVCDARDDIGKQVKKLSGLTLTTATKSQVDDSLDAIKDDLSTIKDATGDLSGQRKKDVQAANDAFAAAVKDTADSLGKTTSIDAAVNQLKHAFDQLATSYQSSFGQLKCS